jgi:hypothetical protein
MAYREPYFINVDDLRDELKEFGEVMGERIDSLRKELASVLADAELVEALADGLTGEAIRLLAESVDNAPADPYDTLSTEVAIDYWARPDVRDRLHDVFTMCSGTDYMRLRDLACAADDLDDFLDDAVSGMRDLIELLENAGDATTIYSADRFEQHAKDEAEELFDLDIGRWPACHIDWTAAAEDLMSDYTAIEFRGESWLYRA